MVAATAKVRETFSSVNKDTAINKLVLYTS